MTPEERERMNELCVQIQEEKNYDKFVTQLRELSDLIARKEQRRFNSQPRIVWQRTRPWMTVSAVVNKIIHTGLARQPEKVEISIIPADYLFREIRIPNALTSPEGATVALKQGARLDVTFEAEASETLNASRPPA